MANVAAAFSKTDKKSPVKNVKNTTANKWKKVKVPVKALVLLKLSAQKKENSKSGISKRKTVKPNPVFKKDAWKKSSTATVKSSVSKSTISRSPSKSNSKSNLTDKKPLTVKAKSSLDSGSKLKNPARKGILKTEPAVRSRKKSVTINPRERKSISGRSPRSRTSKSLGNKTKDDHLEQTPDSPKTEAEVSETEKEGECSESRKMAVKHWRKIRLMLHYMKLPPPGIINLAQQNTKGKEEISFTANLKALQMMAKFKEISSKQKNTVPRCGGKRDPGSFDYLGSL